MPEANVQPSPWRARFWLWALLGALGGLSLGIIGAWQMNSQSNEADSPWLLSETEVPMGPTSPTLIEEFLVDWERYRSSEYVAVATLHRRTKEGSTLELPNVVVQQPPRRVSSNGLETLHRNHVGPEETAKEIELWRSYLEGDLPLYRIRVESNCYHLRLARVIHAPPYGQRAEFCFDGVTGALARSFLERVEGSDELVLDWARTTVVEADFNLVLENEINKLPEER